MPYKYGEVSSSNEVKNLKGHRTVAKSRKKRQKLCLSGPLITVPQYFLGLDHLRVTRGVTKWQHNGGKYISKVIIKQRFTLIVFS